MVHYLFLSQTLFNNHIEYVPECHLSHLHLPTLIDFHVECTLHYKVSKFVLFSFGSGLLQEMLRSTKVGESKSTWKVFLASQLFSFLFVVVMCYLTDAICDTIIQMLMNLADTHGCVVLKERRKEKRREKVHGFWKDITFVTFCSSRYVIMQL